MSIPDHHKKIAKHLLERFGEPADIHMYRDNQGKRPIPVGAFGAKKSKFYSTIGVSDEALAFPDGQFEFATIGEPKWLPNALTTSVYWVRERKPGKWPLICEDVVKQNIKSTYRHMIYIPSPNPLNIDSDRKVNWLLGLPIFDSQLQMTMEEAVSMVGEKFPNWLVKNLK